MTNLSTQAATLLLGDTTAQRGAIAALCERRAWSQVVALAKAWRVVPQLRRRTAALAAPLDEIARRELHAASVAAAAQSTLVAHRAVVVVQRLDAAGIPALAFKGIGLIAGLYRTPGRRMVSDIDLLIDAVHVEAASVALSDLGFAAATRHIAAYVDYLDRRPHEGASSGNLSLALIDRDGIELDLHWRLGTTPSLPMTAARLIARGESVAWHGATIRVAAPLDAMVLTAHHVLRANFAPYSTVKDACDLAAWWDEHGTRWSVADLVGHAQQCGLGIPLLALWQILVSFHPTSPALAGVAALTAAVGPAAQRDATQLQALFQRQLGGEALNEDVLRLLSPLVIARFVARRLRRDQTARQLEVEMSLPHESYPARARRLLHDAARLTPTTLRQYSALLRAHRRSQSARTET